MAKEGTVPVEGLNVGESGGGGKGASRWHHSRQTKPISAFLALELGLEEETKPIKANFSAGYGRGLERRCVEG